MGEWMALNGESIYGTQAALFKPDWGRVTRKEGTLYLHVFDWPEDGKLIATWPTEDAAVMDTALLLTQPRRTDRVLLIGTGTELHIALEAQALLGERGVAATGRRRWGWRNLEPSR